ncbi:MAG: hypothetical protein WBV90_18280 [Terrimicrobiaceae bacterium]
MWKNPIWLLAVAGAISLPAQESSDQFGSAVKRSLDRARALYPQSVEPESALSKAVLARIEWLHHHNRSLFADPNWPLRVTATEAAALGISPQRASPPRAASDDGRRFLAVVTQNFGTAGASFRKNQQILLESVEDYGKRGITIVNDQPVLLWLDNIRILREISRDEALPVVVKVESAGYGIPGGRAYSVTGMVQSLIIPDNSGRYEILVSDALLTPAAAKRLKREIIAAGDPAAGQSSVRAPDRVLTVTYTLKGSTRTKQAAAGETLVLD